MRLMDERDREVAPLAEELREAQQRNHFSEMVALAIRRHRGQDDRNGDH